MFFRIEPVLILLLRLSNHPTCPKRKEFLKSPEGNCWIGNNSAYDYFMPKIYPATLSTPSPSRETVLSDKWMNKLFLIWLFQVSLMGSQKLPGMSLEAWEVELEQANFLVIYCLKKTLWYTYLYYCCSDLIRIWVQTNEFH